MQLPEDGGPGSEQKQWEEEQLRAAKFAFGAKDKKTGGSDEYDFVFEDQIDFIMTDSMAGEHEVCVRRLGGRGTASFLSLFGFN
jgi:hypothetical protein